jgi:hypothetical protein
MKFRVTEVQTVIHTYTYTYETADEDELSYVEAHDQACCAAIPDDAKHTSELVSGDTDVRCLHQNQDVNDRNIFVCQDCQEELGR